MASRWTEETLNAARLEGDKDVDPLIAEVLQHRPGASGIGRIGYNHILDLADALVTSPELALVSSTMLRQQMAVFAERKPEIANFFDPMEAPDWVDEDKLTLAAKIWDIDGILAIAVLYASSLPSCYLMKKGVPALYDTSKLADHKYVFQRIYETGLMLESVMQAGGIKVSRDLDLNPDDRMAELLNKLDPEGNWAWQGPRLRRGAGDTASTPIDVSAARQEFDAITGKAKRYLWGPGYICARKVRFLHSSMRFMLMNPDAMRKAPEAPPDEAPVSVSDSLSRRPTPWDVKALGVPINQEDLAFVLLTFGYLIPKGMGFWGREVTAEQREAFLHLWKVVGYVMGIREDLMTDSLVEAEALYAQILQKNGGTSEPSVILTNAVMDFLRSYLPAHCGLEQTLPVLLIRDQLGDEWARQIIPPKSYAAATRLLPRLAHGLLRTGVRMYFWLRHNLIRHIPLVGTSLAGLTGLCAQTLIDSWRDSFRRKPFYVPSQSSAWVRQKGVTPEYELTLMNWRRKLFDWMAVGLASVVFSGTAFSLAVAFFFLKMHHERRIAMWTGVALAILATVALKTWVPAIAKARPVIKD